MEIISRKEAKERGLKRYFTGKPCKHGHVSERQVSNGACFDCLPEVKARYRNKNKDKIAEWQREHYKQNKDTLAEWQREHRKQNPVPYFLRDSLKRIFINWKGGRKKMEKLHGYTYEQLVTRIESQFKEGMSWENRSEWHIDHIKPIKAFLDEGITDPKIINALDNLQPLWAKDNLSKGAKNDD